ncbi:uncharacterized protein LOC115395812 [Salarias fasciatus]|uniref:uncharacterized protein LOC115395812 n=1 Tax=Salarias fasciatus TaxID=181472 RepID=UPI001176E0EF|nr:uncharacterized protein LOC115395812 [Salarias fasciatus]
MTTRRTRLGGEATDFTAEHLDLVCLKAKGIGNSYLCKENIPRYPHPEFRVCDLKHETDPRGLKGIYRDSGFRGSRDEGLVWFNLAVGPKKIRAAEKRLLKKTFSMLAPNNFLWKFATSPAFSETSMYGSFRFTLPLQEVLDAYSQQFCPGDRPVMRVFRTSVFKQEVQYVVLVHRPKDIKRFSKYPLLEDQREDAVCTYRGGHFIWRPEAMCGTHRYEMDVGSNWINAVPVKGRWEYYVWDEVSIALHLEPGEVLRLSEDQLRKHLTYCDKFDAPFMDFREDHFLEFDEAQLLVEELWPSAGRNKHTAS